MLALLGVVDLLKSAAEPEALSSRDRAVLQELADDPSKPVPFRLRLVAWWEGYDFDTWLRHMLDGDGQSVVEGKAGAKRVSEDAVKPLLWSASRIEVVEQIWGPGYTNPCTGDHVRNMVKTLGLTPAMSVLELGSGLGGIARLMVEEFGAWVTGLEENKLLADAGNQRSVLNGMGKQAPVAPYDPETFELKKRFDCVFSKEAFFTVERKQRMVETLVRWLKPRGQLLFTDYVLDPASTDTRIMEAWRRVEPIKPLPWTVDQYRRQLDELEMDMRIIEDITDEHRQLALGAWSNFTDVLRDRKASRETLMLMFYEAELWARRVNALDHGLKVYRFFGFRPGDPVS